MNAGSPLWQWPLQSPRRLLATLAVAAAVVVALALLLNSRSSGPSSAAPAPASPSSSTTGAPAPSPSASPSPPSAKDYDQAIETARSFVKAWANHRPASVKAWYASTARYATDEMALQLTTVDYRNVPAKGITGKLRLTDTGGVGQTEVAVPTDGGMMSVSLVQDSKGGWLVSDIQPGAQAVR